MRTFIIGYGSLLKKSSLNRTLPEVQNVEPIYLNNYARSWNASENLTPTISTTYLGIRKIANARMNGIIFEVKESYLPTLDKREFLYARVKVDYKDIDFISSTFEIGHEDNVWIYLTTNPESPSVLHPIIESYVDTCISGAFELEEKFGLVDFAKDFILMTENWSQHWVNDRLYPRAPHIMQPDAYRIDKLLHETIRKYFEKIEVE